MKTLYFVFILTLATCFQANAQAPANDLSTFLGGLQKYVLTHNIYYEANMPVAKPDGSPATMPSPDVTEYMEDPETGLRYYAKHDKIMDSLTRCSYQIATGKIALEPVKEEDTAFNKN